MSETSSDVIVVGGGIIGCSIAYRLGRGGASVTLLERGECGREASWAGAGFVEQSSVVRDDPLARLRRASMARYPAFCEELTRATGIDPEFINCGSLDLITDDNQEAAARREDEAAAALPALRNGPQAEHLTRKRARQLEPELRGRIRGALLRRATFQVRNPRLMASLRAALPAVGVLVREHCPVVDFATDDATVTGVRTASATFHAAHVVLAAGAWSSAISSMLDGQIAVRPVRGQIVQLEMIPRPFSHILSHGKTYLVCRRDGKILVGSTEEPRAGFDKNNTASGVEKLLREARRFVPLLEHARLLRCWAGLRPGSADNKPYIGPVADLPGLIVATGHSRSGLTLAPITAELVADLILSGSTAFPLDPFLPGRES